MQKEIEKLLSSLAYGKDIRTVFTDLLDVMLFGLFVQDEAGYRRNPLDNYEPEEHKKFAQLMDEIAKDMEANGNIHDSLGDLFMEHLSHGRNGQFFTPQPICDMMATITETEYKDGQMVNDPACGSGRTLLGMAKKNRNLIFTGSDIDIICVKMCVINLAYNNLKGIIIHGDPLSLEAYSTFIIDKDLLTGFPYILTQKDPNAFKKQWYKPFSTC